MKTVVPVQYGKVGSNQVQICTKKGTYLTYIKVEVCNGENETIIDNNYPVLDALNHEVVLSVGFDISTFEQVLGTIVDCGCCPLPQQWVLDLKSNETNWITSPGVGNLSDLSNKSDDNIHQYWENLRFNTINPNRGRKNSCPVKILVEYYNCATKNCEIRGFEVDDNTMKNLSVKGKRIRRIKLYKITEINKSDINNATESVVTTNNLQPTNLAPVTAVCCVEINAN